MSNKLAPILLIGFNRPRHFKETLIALSKNKLAKESTLYISIDGSRNNDDLKLQKTIFDNIQLADGCFAKINIFRNNTNKGLANNIIDSISNILSSHNKIIVLEDDVVTSRAFIKFMNDALSYYEDKKRIWQINGYSPINNINKKDSIYFSRLSHCWGWATWRDRWEFFNKSPVSIVKEFDKEMIYKFNLDGEVNFWDQIIQNKLGKIDTWAIFWYARVSINNGLCVCPWFSYVKNIGFDGSGTNCYELNSKTEIDIINNDGNFISNNNLIEDKKALAFLKKTNNRTFIKSLFVKLVNNLFGYNFSYKIKSFLRRI